MSILKAAALSPEEIAERKNLVHKKKKAGRKEGKKGREKAGKPKIPIF